ncbi:MAG: gliding motility-associated C-terminal domain-containing protein, partial [Elusimicrobia bacterium]|nr:gliding motility-associated C-terminal domain-containing protein [Elusimicrobiota bacterium]
AYTVYHLRIGSLNWDLAPNFSAAGSTRTLIGPPPADAAPATVWRSSIAVSWPAIPSDDGYSVEASTAADFSGLRLSSVTASGAATTLAVGGLDANATYFLRVGALWNGATAYVQASPASTATWAEAVAGQLTAVYGTSATVSWTPLPPSPPASSGEGYRLEASTAPDFSGAVASSSTLDVGADRLGVSGLSVDTVYFFRLASLNWNGAPHFAVAGSTRVGPPPADARVTGVGVSTLSVAWSEVGATDGYEARASTASDFSGAAFSSVTASWLGEALELSGLSPNTTYFVRAGSLWDGATAFAQSIATVTLAPPPAGGQFLSLWQSSITVGFAPVAAAGYRLEASTSPDLSEPRTSAATADPAATAVAIDGLYGNVTYYFRLAALNWAGAPSYAAVGSTRIPVFVHGFGGASGFRVAKLAWSDLSALEKGPQFVGYNLYRASESAGPFSLLASTPATSYTDTAVLVGATYYYQIVAETRPSVDADRSSTTVLLVGSAPPRKPVGLRGTPLDPSTVRLGWLPVTAFDNGVAFESSTAPATGELSDYDLYRATAPFGAAWTLAASVSSGTLSWDAPASTSTAFYYQLRGRNRFYQGEPSMPLSAAGQAVAQAPGAGAVVEIPGAVVASLAGASEATTVVVTLSTKPAASAATLQTLTIGTERGGQEISNPQLPGKVKVKFSYERDAGGSVVAAVDPSPANLSVYWLNGVRWIQLYGTLHRATQEIAVDTEFGGDFELRFTERPTGFSADAAGLSNRTLTPNGDGFNDSVVVVFNNPRDSKVTGKVYDLRGKLVAPMTPGPVANSLKWNGQADGQTAATGVYIYQLEAEGTVYNGTVLVVR